MLTATVGEAECSPMTLQVRSAPLKPRLHPAPRRRLTARHAKLRVLRARSVLAQVPTFKPGTQFSIDMRSSVLTSASCFKSMRQPRQAIPEAMTA
jgi:hypothetical protein